MSGAKKLSENDKDDEQVDPSESNDSDSSERQRATLLRNELISGNEEIAKRVMQSAKFAIFPSGHKLIEQGHTDDCVYFIIAGSTKVRINKRHIDVRSAPHTVGEMAAKKAGEVRTADVIVQSQQLEVLVLSGAEFRKLMRDYPAFSARLHELIDNLSRSKIAQLGEKDSNAGLPWLKISAGVAVAAGVVGAFLAWFMNLAALYILCASLPLALLVFVGMLLLNPELRFRNIFSAGGAALIMLIAYGTFSFTLTIDGKEVDVPLLVNFSVETEQKVEMFGISVVALLILTFIAGYFDMRISKTRNEK